MQSSLPDIELARRQAGRFLGEVPISVQAQTGGLSGAMVWRVEVPRGTFALRQYPVEFPTQERLQWLHQILQTVQERGCRLLPCPVVMPDGRTWLEQDSRYWECLAWVHGEPLLETAPSRELLVRAAESLAELHLVLQSIAYPTLPEFGLSSNHASGLKERRRLLQSWYDGEENQISAALANKVSPAILAQLFAVQRSALWQQGLALKAQLDQAVTLDVPIFPVLRDVRPAHVIFGDLANLRFIDVAALRPDSAAADLARLLQNWRYRQADWYAAALSAYCRKRPLSAAEAAVMNAYDASARLLTGVQWLRWLVLESREFSPATLESHLPPIIQRLQEFAWH